MALYECFTFELRKVLTAFVRLAPPHANHGILTRLPEAVDEPDMVLEVMIQNGPLNGNRSIHDGVSTPASGPHIR